MTREIITGNGRLAVALDKWLRVRDFFYPRVGSENHLSGHDIKLGVWVNGKFSWVDEHWETSAHYLPETQVSRYQARNPGLGIEIEVNDAVHFTLDLYLRKISVRNLSGSPSEVRVFLAHDFHIYGRDAGDTALYNPYLHSIVHYKGQRHFLISGITGRNEGFSQFATGNKESAGLEGTWRDAEDGVLSNNPIAQGSVDSVISYNLFLQPNSGESIYYWIACGNDNEAVEALHLQVRKTGVEQLLLETENYWSAWVNKRNIDLSLLPQNIIRIFKTSLLIMRMHVDNGGAIIASADSDVLKFNRDTYAYVWPRDGAICALAFDLAGFDEISRLFFDYCNEVISQKGFFYHKYWADGSQGSSWHPLVNAKGLPQLPIQEDETALVLHALWNHFQRYRDMEFIARVYPNLVIKTSDFLLSYVDQSTGLPYSSFDIWEERYGVFTATVAAVCNALSSAAKFARVFYDSRRYDMLSQSAKRMRDAMMTNLYSPDSGSFLRAIYPDANRDSTADSSLAFIFAYGPLSASDPEVVSTLNNLLKHLWLNTGTGGMARYENDGFYRVSGEVTGNPWFICTLWLARWYIAQATSVPELQKALEILTWTSSHASQSGLLAEQIHPFTGEPISVSPLIWSHAEFVIAVCQYLEKYTKLVSGKEIK